MRKLRNSELNRLTVDEFKEKSKTPLIVVLDNIRSCNNIGSVFRTSDAFLIEKIYLCGITATPPNKEIHKTALDAEKSVEWKYLEKTEDAVTELKNAGFNVYAIEQVENSISLPDFKPEANEKLAIVFGNEVKGVQQKVVNLCDGSIEIPQFGTKHSFNVSVSAGIILWDLFQKMNEEKNAGKLRLTKLI
ncbi:TrmH family RNA methyltransferase [Maribellus comscasis]|uniref:TrmH family RNA methyltransferase n=1 Tax=Maribellus comscasis TaxID=2681766 RepID=A0A6I6JS36_9BACT|nr:RNA methyltransferase [Maribellus comscasis]QGY45251.1 TrmH family RNA methyltransferase [Maribellus comscasis]